MTVSGYDPEGFPFEITISVGGSGPGSVPFVANSVNVDKTRQYSPNTSASIRRLAAAAAESLSGSLRSSRRVRWKSGIARKYRSRVHRSLPLYSSTSFRRAIASYELAFSAISASFQHRCTRDVTAGPLTNQSQSRIQPAGSTCTIQVS
jgi:hypothetical protein